MREILLGLSLGCALVLLGACGGQAPLRGEAQDGPGERAVDDQTPDALPRSEPRSRYGNPDSYVVYGTRYYTRASAEGYVERGIASWYGTKFHGRRTSSGEPYDMYAMTAAHKTLPLPSYVRVTNLKDGRSAVLRVNDRGPFHANRIIDLSYAAAKRLGIAARGTGLVEVRALDPEAPPAPPQGPPVAAHSDLFIQVGAFSSLENAHRLRDELRSHGFSKLKVERAPARGQTLYRVRIGPLESVDDTDHTAQQLVGIGIDYRVVVD
jgi:rare lipoprotein A